MRVSPLGDSAIVIAMGESLDAETTVRATAVAAAIRQKALSGVEDVVPAFGTVAVFFDPTRAGSFEMLRSELETVVNGVEAVAPSDVARTLEIPVCYDEEHGPDLKMIAARLQKAPREVAALHASAEYLVHAIGFAPGFPYLGGLPAELATPRRGSPRACVPAGSVGIGGVQTGVYPLETPGGWNLIGRTPLRLFDAMRPVPALLRAGDRVRFRAIGADEFSALATSASTSPAREAAAGEDVSTPSMDDAHAAVAGVDVLRAGMFTTVQDSGRRGHRANGVPSSGAADAFALRLANLLVGNKEDQAALEFTLVGPELRFLHDTVVALGGGEFGRLPRWRPIAMRKGTVLKIGPATSGCRGYLAIAGGIDVPPVLGSRSTYVRARLGGHEGRRLVNGDVLPVPDVRRTFSDHWTIDERIVPLYSATAVVRVIAGAHAEQFDPNWRDRAFKVSTQSDRMGVRLLGAPLSRRVAGDLLSSAVAPGTIQVPPDGLPIVLLADAQTIGGYPKVAHVITVDLPIMAQLRPGDEVRFVPVTLTDARELVAAQERAIGLLGEGLAQKLA